MFTLILYNNHLIFNLQLYTLSIRFIGGTVTKRQGRRMGMQL